MDYTIAEAADILGLPCTRHGGYVFNELSNDSRRLSFPGTTLFFALKTATGDGHKYISEAYSLGVRSFMVSARPSEGMDDAAFLEVPDVLSAVQRLAETHRKRFGCPVIGITGSNGKSVVKEFLYHLLCREYNIVRSPKSYNSQIGVPLSVWNMSSEHNLGIFEAGISMPGEMERLERIILPDIGVITNIGPAHQENFRSYYEKAMEKLKLFSRSRSLVYCSDDPVLSRAVKDSGLESIAVPWSRTDRGAHIFVESVSAGELSTTLVVSFDGKTRTFSIPFTDAASVENVLHCIGVLYCLDSRLLDNSAPFATLEPVAMRLEVKQGRNGSLLINDTYNSDINSLAIALDFMSGRKKSGDYRTTLILSDILQSGSEPEDLYHRVSEIVSAKGVDRLIGIGPVISSFSQLFRMDKSFYASTADFLSVLRSSDFSGELVLIKGSRNFHFEKITERLEQRVHETIMEVNLDAVVHNFNRYKSKLKPSTKMVCMVKASAYGAGAVEVARTLQEHRCDALAVAVADEGVDLRNHGISIPIIIMNPEISSLNVLYDYNLEPEVYSFRLYDAFVREGVSRGASSFPIHVKIDTGMHRLGFSPEEIPSLAALLKGQNVVRVKSVFSHLAGSDTPELDDFTMSQIRRFTDAASLLEKLTGDRVLKHILNSSGIERFPEYQMDMVRLGIGLYGISMSGDTGLKNVSTLKTTILQIRNVPAGDSIGYGRRTYVERDSKIAVIPIGYADGLDRHLSNRVGKVMVNGSLVPIVGNICMDACMIDVTEINAEEGDTVIIFGDSLPVSYMAGILGTIPYEILTSPSPRVQRVYIND